MTDDNGLNIPDDMDRGSQLDADADAPADLADAIFTVLEEIDAGETPKNLTLRDKQIAALIRGLESNPERLNDVGEAFCEALDIEMDGEMTRSDILRLAVRFAFREVSPETVEALREANRKQADSVF